MAHSRRHLLLAPPLAGALLLVACWRAGGLADRPVSTRAARSAAGRIQLDVPLYKQWDARWAGERIGGSGEEIRRVGCVVSCVAMVFAHYRIEVTPKELNDYLKSHDGYTGRGWLKWEVSAAFAAGRVAFAHEGGADHGRIDACLARGDPVIVKVMLAGGVPHWVLVVGKEGTEYLVNDPLGTEPYPVPLSRLGELMYAMRVFRRTAAR